MHNNLMRAQNLQTLKSLNLKIDIVNVKNAEITNTWFIEKFAHEI